MPVRNAHARQRFEHLGGHRIIQQGIGLFCAREVEWRLECLKASHSGEVEDSRRHDRDVDAAVADRAEGDQPRVVLAAVLGWVGSAWSLRPDAGETPTTSVR